MRLTSARSTERRAFRLPTVTPKRTLLACGLLIGAVATHAAFIDNICRSARIDRSRGARRTAAELGGRLEPAHRGKTIAVDTSGHLERQWRPSSAASALSLESRRLPQIPEALPAFGAACGNHGATTARSHAHQKPVRASALDLRGLISSFGGHHTLYVLFVQPAIRRDSANCCQTSPAPAASHGKPLVIAPQLKLIRHKRDLLWITRCGMSRIQGFAGGCMLCLFQTAEMQRTATGREQACVKTEPVRAAMSTFAVPIRS